jgi:chromosome segregation ATPase
MIRDDGFEKNVAEKMPKIRRGEELFPSDLEDEPKQMEENHPGMVSSEERTETKTIQALPKKGTEREQDQEVLGLIEDLHAQLLASGRTKRALEMDLSSSQKTIQHLAQDNKDLRNQLENLRKELQKFKEIQSESIYLEEENADALEKIQEFQRELRSINETLAQTLQERDGALNRIADLESQMEQNELLQIKGRLKEREASHFSEENRELQSKLEEALAHNVDLEKKYESLKRSFNEVKESLTLLRDSCKTNYYNLSQTLG